MKVPYISVSRMNVWQSCQQQYKFKYHLGIEVDAEDPIYFTYGSVVHKIAEEYVAARGDRPITEIAQDVLNGTISLGEGKNLVELPAEYKRKLPQHLLAVQRLTAKTGFDGELEYSFRYDLDPPHRRMIFGYIDRLIRQGNKFWILDYKTTKPGWFRKNSRTILDDLQLRAYARVVQKTFKVPAQNVKAALFYLEGEELVGARFTEQSLAAAEQELLQAYLDIENTPPEAAVGHVDKHCRYCQYKSMCPSYSLT